MSAISSTCSAQDNAVLVPDPVYPVYVDTNVDGRPQECVFADANAGNGFLPLPDASGTARDIIYLCSPNNPTGAAYDRAGLQGLGGVRQLRRQR